MGKSTKLKKHKIVLVKWNDAESIDAWTQATEVDHSIAPVQSVGWLLKDDADSITLALNHDVKNESYSCLMKIPRGMIVGDIKTLKS